MTDIATHRPFDILVVPFPFSDEEHRQKLRPALVVSTVEYNQKNSSLVLAMITSAKKSNFFGDCKISDYKNTNLRNECVVRMKLFTIDSALIKGKIGSLSKGDIAKVKKSLGAILQR